MKYKASVLQAAAFLFAWLMLIGVAAAIDALLGAMVAQTVTTLWLCIGLWVMLLKGIAFPMPNPGRIDIRGAFRSLWWATFWPQYLR